MSNSLHFIKRLNLSDHSLFLLIYTKSNISHLLFTFVLAIKDHMMVND